MKRFKVFNSHVHVVQHRPRLYRKYKFGIRRIEDENKGIYCHGK